MNKTQLLCCLLRGSNTFDYSYGNRIRGLWYVVEVRVREGLLGNPIRTQNDWLAVKTRL